MARPVLIAAESIRTSVELEPIVSISNWWQGLAIVSALLAMMALTIFFTWRDQKEHPTGIVLGLLVLRLALLACLFVAGVNLERRREKVVETPSSLAVILDNSLSMKLDASKQNEQNRFEAAKDWIKSWNQLDELSSQHELVFYQLQDDGNLKEYARLAKRLVTQSLLEKPTAANSGFGWWFALLSLLLFAYAGIFAHDRQTRGVIVLAAVLVFVFSAIWLSLAFIGDDSRSVPGQGSLPVNGSQVASGEQLDERDESRKTVLAALEVRECDLPNSPLVASINQLLERTDAKSLAGVILLSDGADSEDGDFLVAAENANRRSIPMFPVGFGSRLVNQNVTIRGLDSAKKVAKGNPILISGNLAVEGTKSPTEIELKLTSISTQADPATERPTNDATKIVNFEEAGLKSFAFELPPGSIGLRTYTVTASPIADEINQEDNASSVTVEVVDRKTKVLLFSGGPSREFRFLRNQLYRDPRITVDVLLQSADRGAFQESDRLLTEFPADEQAFNDYDCLVAIDPDWSELSNTQTEMVRTWVAQEAGGLIVVAGPVNTPVWTSLPANDPVTAPIRKLYPVTFFGQATGSVKLGRFGGDEPFPLAFTRESRAFDFLRFDNDPQRNETLWNNVKVFGYYAVNQEKAGAAVIAHFSDPLTSFGGRLPIYLASQLYGNGRVFFQASGELWRTRGVGPEFFEQYYSRLIGWVSQGRLMRGEDSMTLNLDKDNCIVGDYVTVRVVAKRNNTEFNDLDQVVVTMTRESSLNQSAQGNNVRQELTLPRLTSQDDGLAFETRIRFTKPGRHRFLMVIPGSSEPKTLEAQLTASLPNVELAEPGLNELGLQVLAENSGGQYLHVQEFNSKQWSQQVSTLLSDHSFETVSPLTNDLSFTRKLHFCLFCNFALLLTVSWLLRRLNRLA